MSDFWVENIIPKLDCFSHIYIESVKLERGDGLVRVVFNLRFTHRYLCDIDFRKDENGIKYTMKRKGMDDFHGIFENAVDFERMILDIIVDNFLINDEVYEGH